MKSGNGATGGRRAQRGDLHPESCSVSDRMARPQLPIVPFITWFDRLTMKSGFIFLSIVFLNSTFSVLYSAFLSRIS